MTKLLEEIELNKLSSLSHVLIQLLTACHDDNACFDTLTDIISKDPGLTAKVISVANSPAYAKKHELSTLKHVLLFLGLENIRSIAITASVQQFFSRYSKDKTRFLKKFWYHTLYVAVFSRTLAKLISYDKPEQAYITGLLHDIGQLIFESYDKDSYSESVQAIDDRQKLLEYEKESYGVMHDAIGASVLELWGLEPEICDAVKYHHAESSRLKNTHWLVRIINFAEFIIDGFQKTGGLVSGYQDRPFDVSDSILLDLLKKSEEEVLAVARSLDIDINDSEAVYKRDEGKQIQLAKDIRDISLVQNSLNISHEGDIRLDFSQLYLSAFYVFNVSKVNLYLFNEELNTLELEQHSVLRSDPVVGGAGIEADSNSVVTESLSTGEVKSLLKSEVNEFSPVIDSQLINRSESEGIICVPLRKSENKLGVLMLGVNESQAKDILNRASLIRFFAYEISLWILNIRSRYQSVQQVLDQSSLQVQQNAKEVIHEINNPLTIIKNYLHILGGRLKEDEAAINDLEIIRDEINRVGEIVLKCDSSLQNFRVQDSVQKTDINATITSINKILSSSLYITYDIKTSVELDDNIPEVNLNKNYLNQILTNLIKNAVEAMQDVRELFIATRNVNINGKAYVEIEISDTGPGIPGEIQQHMYEPVNTTKGANNSGLGLSIVKNLLDEMDGVITCKTGSKGTSFNIELPV